MIFVEVLFHRLSVTALSLITINATNGVEAGTEAADRHAETADTPLVFVFNQLDHDNSNFDSALSSAKHHLEIKLQLFNIRLMRAQLSLQLLMF